MHFRESEQTSCWRGNRTVRTLLLFSEDDACILPTLLCRRLDVLESQFSVMQTNMMEILGILRRGESAVALSSPSDAGSIAASSTATYSQANQQSTPSSSSPPTMSQNRLAPPQSDVFQTKSLSSTPRYQSQPSVQAQSPYPISGEPSGRQLNTFSGSPSAS